VYNEGVKNMNSSAEIPISHTKIIVPEARVDLLELAECPVL
jgi:hypothetical protein